MGMSRGKREKVWWNWRERQDTNCRHKIKTFRLKITNYIDLQSNLKIFITSIYMNSRKVLKEGMRVICCIYRMTKVNIQRRRLCS